WLVSERLRRVMEAVDPGAFAFVETDYRLADGSKGPNVYLCEVIRTLDALDEDASMLKIEVSDDFEEGKYYDLTGEIRLAFKRDVLGDAHVFRLAFHGGVFCDRLFKDAVEAAGIGTDGQSDGLWFYDVVNR
ncbi:imm11 family protein, partial [Xanthomonas hortorum]